MIEPKIFCDWSINIPPLPVPVEIYCDGGVRSFDPDSDAIKILWINEPREILSMPYDHALNEGDKYDIILTWDQHLLDLGRDNIYFFRNYMCWMSGYDFPEKSFGVSTVVGAKASTVGHKLRHELWARRNEITTPKDFYISQYGGPAGSDGTKQLGWTKKPLFNSQFHIAIENVKSQNMISEKLNDACATKTVPIYWGCPNVDEAYDTRGIIQCNTVDQIIQAANSITPELYEAMLPYVEENYKRAKDMTKVSGRLSETIERLINTMKDGTNLLED